MNGKDGVWAVFASRFARCVATVVAHIVGAVCALSACRARARTRLARAAASTLAGTLSAAIGASISRPPCGGGVRAPARLCWLCAAQQPVQPAMARWQVYEQGGGDDC